jgi:hypothetical protein
MLLLSSSPIGRIDWWKVEEQQDDVNWGGDDDHVGLVDVDVASNLEEQNLDH